MKEHAKDGGRALSGEPVEPLPPGRWPGRAALVGHRVTLEPLDASRHAAPLYAASHADEAARALWRFLPYGPFSDPDAFAAWLRERAAQADPVFYAVCERLTGRPAGMASYLDIRPLDGAIEIGHIWFAPALQRVPAATEALFLLLGHAFDELGYRRMQWRCNALNDRSRRAARRLGFRFEGIFFRHMVAKGRNRDTAWYSILDDEWPALRANFEAWLDPANFDADGGQKRSLSALNAALDESGE